MLAPEKPQDSGGVTKDVRTDVRRMEVASLGAVNRFCEATIQMGYPFFSLLMLSFNLL